MYNFEILKEGDISLLMQESGIVTFNDACRFVRDIRYERISNSKDISLVFHERKGTCSSKHAFLKTIAEEQGENEVKLFLALFKMNASSHSELKPIFDNTTLTYIPEAHVYLKVGGERLDFTFKQAFDVSKFLISEEEVNLNFIINEKIKFHKKYIQSWNDTELKDDEIWNLREECISLLT